MASFSCLLLVVVIICSCEKVACMRPAGSLYQYKAADTLQENGQHDKTQSGWVATWKHDDGQYNLQGHSGSFWSSEKAIWKQEIGCSPCEEVYVVRDDGETLQTISEKCHAPFILLDNPHVQDTDDISTGSVLLISSTHLPC